jgi:hypothetical protein
VSEAAAPVVATPAVPPPTLGALMTAPDAPEAATLDTGESGDSGDEAADARRKAREVLFSDKEPEEASADADKSKGAKPAEKKPELEPEVKEDEVQLSKKWAKVRAQEDRLVKRQKEFAEQQRAFEASKSEVESLKTKLAEREAQMNDPVKFLAAAGWTKDRIVEWIQSDGKVDPEILVKQFSEKHQKELEELKAERERERQELLVEKQSRQLETLKHELDTEVATMAKTDPEFALLQKFIAKKGEAGVQKRVRDIIAQVFNQKKQVVDPRDVLVYLERELAEIQLGDSPGQVPAARPANPVAVEPKPITNQATSQRTVVPVEYDESDPEARRARAAAILRGEIQADDE